MHILQTGVIPGKTTQDHPELSCSPHRGDVYFYKYTGDPTDDSMLAAISYAEQIAMKHHFMGMLGLDFSDEQNTLAAYEIIDYWPKRLIYRDKLMGMGFSEHTIDQAQDEAAKYKGVLLGLSSRVTDRRYPIVLGDDGWKIETITGLPYSYIQGIKFLSEHDEQLFHRLLTS
jgi:hypothetical protein